METESNSLQASPMSAGNLGLPNFQNHTGHISVIYELFFANRYFSKKEKKRIRTVSWFPLLEDESQNQDLRAVCSFCGSVIASQPLR